MSRTILLLLSAASLLTTFRTRLVQIHWAQDGWSAASPQPSFPASPVMESDLDSDGFPEQVVLGEDRLRITGRGQNLWSSPVEWKITAAQIADLNRDGRMEVAMLVWRPFAPWPVDAWLPHGGRIEDFHDMENQSCHIILWGWTGEIYRELWAGSALAEPVLSFFAADWNTDGRQELMAVETDYNQPSKAGAFSLWEWNGFGFSLIDRLNTDVGKFVFLIDGNGRTSILFDPSRGFFQPRR